MPQVIAMTVDVRQLFITCSIIELLVAIPASMTLKRIGFSSWWALLCFVPVAAVFALWLLAFIRWPRDTQPVSS
jgi:uncharacterized membrane protein YhaH (DUF805 family)